MDNKQLINEMLDAIEDGDVERVMVLLNSDVDKLNLITPFGTWLHIAASEGQLDIVKKLIDLGVDINKRGGTYDGGAINSAASEGYIEIVKYLLSNGAEFDVSEPTRNPLFGAIMSGNINIVKVLIDNGINTKIKYTGENMTNMDAYAFAIERGQKDIAELIKAT